MSTANEPPHLHKDLARPPRSGDAPYCAFKNDKARLRALISRDIRFVLIAALFVISGLFGVGHAPIRQWLRMVLG
ncbi:hypothetical protein [Stenotrophomonas sp. 1337]|jgi:hypothetical protein|uniref:hypothetical protein n=1 Tax=Stenotrophomonas sp. 1337 TaxID=2817757 RepID=UPI00285DDFED|nr:hypothetical protein [Stenotrophomonas sp. 1337]MDR6694027.1 hypothetical protein [Stenotrophomonas sp. 1337]